MNKYYSLIVHGYTDFFMKNEDGHFFIPDTEKGKRRWTRTVVSEDRIKKMKEVTMLDMIADKKIKVSK